jgi:hypothetical protein
MLSDLSFDRAVGIHFTDAEAFTVDIPAASRQGRSL